MGDGFLKPWSAGRLTQSCRRCMSHCDSHGKPSARKVRSAAPDDDHQAMTHMLMGGDPSKTILGAQIRAARALLRWSAADLVRESGVSHATIHRAEAVNGKPAMTFAKCPSPCSGGRRCRITLRERRRTGRSAKAESSGLIGKWSVARSWCNPPCLRIGWGGVHPRERWRLRGAATEAATEKGGSGLGTKRSSHA
jgi:hypothetical protein